MNGVLGKPYKFLYSARNYVSGLSDIIALVKRPNGTDYGTYALQELTGSVFNGTYYFDLPTTQNDVEGEYSVIIYEQTSSFRQISKVSMRLPNEVGSSDICDPELFGKIIETKLSARILQNSTLTGKMQESILNGSLISNTIKAIIQSEKVIGKINEDILTYRLECNK